MTGPLLKSAPLTHYHAVGAVGHPVYLAAAQLRAAIARRLGAEVADVFAVPQRNEDGDTVDWYAPKPGTVVPWSAATEAERADAQQRLLDVREQIETLGRSMEAEAAPERQVFGRLLAQVMQFPDEQDVHLVDGRPVLTFWGFVKDRAAVGSDPLRDLDRHIATPSTAPVPAVRRPWPWLLWGILAALLLALLLAALLWALRGCEATDNGRTTSPSATAADERRLSGIEPAPETMAAEPPLPVVPDQPVPADGEPFAEPAVVDERDGGTRIIDVDGRGALLEGVGGRTIVDAAGNAIEDREVVGDAVDVDLLDGTDADVLTGAGEGLAADAADAAATDAPTADVMATDPEPDEDGAEAFAVDGAEVFPLDGIDAQDAAATAAADASETGAAAGADTEDTATTEGLPSSGEVSAGDGAAATDASAPGPTEAADAQAVQEPISTGEPQRTGDADRAAGAPEDAAAAGARADPGAAADAAARAAEGAAPVRVPPRQLLNSGWRTSTTLLDPKDGSPVRLSYRLQDGAGKIRLARKDGSVCESDIKGDVRNGRLVIDTQRAIVCDDNTSFGRPQIDCTPQAGGKARCVGRYADGTSFPIDMERQEASAPGAR
jgi:hypothetical protein